MTVLFTHAAILYARGRSIKGGSMQNGGLAYVIATHRGGADALLSEVAAALAGRRVLCGVVQTNTEYDPDRPCHMDLSVLGTPTVLRISQFLGVGSQGCRLDTAGLAGAVGLVEAALERAVPDLLIINKFGKQECAGGGFRPVIGQALAMGIPVLTAVSALNLPGFLAFSGGMATALAADTAAILHWSDG
jgi:hypothetical protein